MIARDWQRLCKYIVFIEWIGNLRKHLEYKCGGEGGIRTRGTV